MTELEQALAAAQLRVALWAAPIISDSNIPIAIELPTATWHALKRTGDTPPLFLIGRRVYCRTEDLRQWLATRAAKGKPGTQRVKRSDKAVRPYRKAIEAPA